MGLRSVASPAYRHLLVIDREAQEHSTLLANLTSNPTPDLEAVRAALASLAADPTRSRGGANT